MPISAPSGSREKDTTSMSGDDRVDILCDAFEHAYKRGEQPQLNDFLGKCAGSERESLFSELMLLEVELRKESGDTPTDEDYLDRFPEFAAVIETIAFKHGLKSTAPTKSKTRKKNRRDKPRVGRFQLGDKIGSGTTGDVWKAFDPRLRRTVAVKVPRQRELSEQELHRFLREGQAAAQLKHAAIVPVHEVGHDEDTAYIVSEFVEGRDLRACLAERRIAPRAAAELCAKLANGLQHAHEKGIVHRDLKPANIMIDAANEPHILDFGLAKWTEDAHQLTLSGHVLGTPAYMSPEQARGDVAAIDCRSDVYALGAVLYEMLTGEHPFAGEPSAVMQAVIEKEPRSPRSIRRDIPRNLETICLKAMNKEPSRRYATAEEMAVDLDRYLRGETIHARRASVWEKSWRAVRRRPAVASALSLAVVAGIAMSAAWMLAEENRALLGVRTVTITTEPAGAEIVFVPLARITGEPLEAELVSAAGVSPVEVELKPGNYLVVARLADGRFHEVFRHVPEDHQTLPGSYHHQFWKFGENGEVILPSIDIPSHEVAAGMALIDGGEGIASFYIDTTEFTVGQLHELNPSGRIPSHIRDAELADAEAVWLDFDRAASAAEKLGKRLPSEAEFQHAATNGATREFPWGEWNETVETQGAAITAWGEVRSPDFDRLEVDPPVYGLCSNVAEWTTSWIAGFPQATSSNIEEYASPTHLRVVRGGDLSVVHGDPKVTRQNRDPKKRSVVPRVSTSRGLGFRCVRSTTPRYFDTR